MSQAELKVIGTIFPTACSVILGNSGEANYGNIPSGMLLDYQHGNELPWSPIVPLTIDCGSHPTQVAITLTDNVPESRVDHLVVKVPVSSGTFVDSDSSKKMFGLGMSNDKKLGAYAVAINKGVVDAVPSSLGLIQEAGGSVRSPADGQWLKANQLSDDKDLVTWAMPGSSEPAIGTLFTAELATGTTINYASELDLSSEVKLGGNATLTVYYL
jgi:hypothetical protein